jgi:hypothetical protein
MFACIAAFYNSAKVWIAYTNTIRVKTQMISMFFGWRYSEQILAINTKIGWEFIYSDEADW